MIVQKTIPFTDDSDGFVDNNNGQENSINGENLIIPKRIMFEPSSEFTHSTPLKDKTNQNQNSTATDSTAVVTNPTANKTNVPLKLTKPELYRFKECKFTTKHSSNLIRHRRIHTGKYFCEKCPNKYQTMHDLNTHKRIKHDSPLICELC